MAMPKLQVPLLFLFFFVFLVLTPSRAQTFGPPLVSPIQKDASTLQYIITAYLQSPQGTKLLLDLGASYIWINCDGYNSSSYRHIPCTTLLDEFVGCFACLMNCRDSNPNCGDSVCVLKPENPFQSSISGNEQYAPALVDYFSMLTLDNTGSIGGPSSSSPFTFIFSCGYKENLEGLARGVTGSAGLGRSSISIPVQASAIFHYPRYFALCLSGSKTRPGAAFVGTKGPYKFGRGIDLSKPLAYTPLLLNPVGKYSYPDLKKPSSEYFVGVTSIKVNGKAVALNQSLLAIDSTGNGSGGTKLSTVVPYTQLETSIYKAVTEAFVKAAASSPFNLTATKPVQPFSVCYPAGNVRTTRTGPTVPAIDLVMHRNDVVWKILGSNSMVRVAEKGGADVWCLGFVDAGVRPETSIFAGDPSIVIGGYQMEDNFLQFDLESMRLGFSSSVLSRGTSCASFRFAAKKG